MHLLVQILFFIGAAQGFLLSFFLFSIKSNKLSNIFLGILTSSYGLILIGFPLQSHGFFTDNPHFLRIIPNFLLLISPLLYLYIKYLLSDIRKFRWVDMVHAIPFILYTLSLIPFYIQDGATKLELTQNLTGYFGTVELIAAEVISLQGLLYSFFAFGRLIKYDKLIENYQSTVYKTSIKLLKVASILVFMAWVLGTVRVHMVYFDINPTVDLWIFVYLVLVIVIYFISYLSLKTPELFKLQEVVFDMPTVIPFGPQPEIKVEKEAIEEEEVQDDKTEEQLKRLNEFMEKEKPYINPELNLISLAKQIKIGRNQLSALINQHHQKNFYEFVNMHRVNEVKELMQKPENKNLKLMAIAYDAGFNSKSSFNRVFKQQTNMTPSEYFKTIS